MKKIKHISESSILPELICFVICLAIYLITLAPTITAEDSGELITAAYDFGVAHPPGYPLWTILTAIWIRVIPFGSTAYRANLLSAVLSALAAAILCKILRKFFNTTSFAAIIGGMCFASGRHLWSQAVITEVYTLHILLVCLIAYFAISWMQSYKNVDLYKMFFLFGLCLSNHNLAVLLGPLIFLLVISLKPRIFISPKIIIICLFLLALGLLPYIYLPIAANTDAYINWGNPDNWQRFTEHVLRKQYGDEAMHAPRSLHRIIGHIAVLWYWNVKQYTVFSVPFIIAGLFYLVRHSRKLFYFTLCFFIMHTMVFAEIINMSFQKQGLYCSRVFFLPVYIITAIWLVIGCVEIGKAISQNIPQFAFSSAIKYLPLLTVTALSIGCNYSLNNMRNYYYALDHADNILNSLEHNAIIIPSGDHNTFPLIYRHFIEGVRPDITIADKYGYIEYKLYKSMPNAPKKIRTRLEREQIEAYLITKSNRPVYYTVKPHLNLLPNYRAVSYGMLFKIQKNTDKQIQTTPPQYEYKNLDTVKAPLDHPASMILSDYYFSLASNSFRQKQFKTGMGYIEKAAELSEGVKEEMNNLGTLLAEFGLHEPAIGFYETAAKLDKNYLTPRWNLAYLFKYQGQIVKAIQVFNDLANLDPKDYRIFGELGFLLQKHGEIHFAVQNWSRSLSLNPNQQQIIEAMAKLKGNSKQPSEAKEAQQ